MNKLILLLCIFFIYAKSSTVYSQPTDPFEIRMENEQKVWETIKAGNVLRLSKYIDSGLEINKRGWDGSTWLVDAITFQQYEIVKLLLENGADPNLRTAPFKDDHDNWIPEDSPLEAALVFDTAYSTAKLLLKYGANVNDTDIYCGTLLHEVITGKGDKMYAELYSENADTNKLKLNENESLKKIQWLVKHGADVNKKNPYGGPPLYSAVSFNYYRAAETLIDNGAECNFSDKQGKTLLHLAESPEFILKLIKKGIDVNARMDDGMTALHYAAFSNNYEKAKLLVENGADVNAADYDSHLTPLGWMIVDDFNYDIAKLLIAHNATIPEVLVKERGFTDEIEKIKSELGK